MVGNIELPVDMFNPQMLGGGMTEMIAQSMGVQSREDNSRVELAPEFADSGLHVVAAAARGAGQSTEGFAAYQEVHESGEHGHEGVMNAVSSLGGQSMNMQHAEEVNMQSVGTAVQKGGPSLG